ncbi:MAG: RluA family pseudouridine synthase [Armatimonadota bacterium]
MNILEFIVDDDNSHRLDVYLSSKIDNLSRSAVQKLIDSGNVLVNNKIQKCGYKIQLSDVIKVTIPPPQPSDIAPQDIPIDVVFEDDYIMVINKSKGMTVHPAPGSPDQTLVNAVLAHSDSLSSVGGVERPGIVHRLDKDTSGLIVVAKTDKSHQSLQEQIQKREVERLYKALVWGAVKFKNAVVDAPIGRHPVNRQKMAVIEDIEKHKAKEAKTYLTLLTKYDHFSLLEAKLDTGRTHQIRVHCSFIGHPVVGDATYGGLKKPIPNDYSKKDQRDFSILLENLNGQALHAFSLSFNHPYTNERMSFSAPIPKDMQNMLDWLEKNHRK